MNFYQFNFRQRRGTIFLDTFQKYDGWNMLKVTKFTSPVDAFIVKGTTYQPYAYLPNPFCIAFTKEIHDALKEIHATGWISYEISIRDCNFLYYGIQIIGKCGPLSRPAKAGNVKGKSFELESWDGSDFFSPTDAGSTFFTDKVKSFFLSDKYFGAEEVVNIRDVSWYSIGASG